MLFVCWCDWTLASPPIVGGSYRCHREDIVCGSTILLHTWKSWQKRNVVCPVCLAWIKVLCKDSNEATTYFFYMVGITLYKKYQAFIPIMASVSHFDSLIKIHTTACFCHMFLGSCKLKWCCFASPVVNNGMNNSIQEFIPIMASVSQIDSCWPL